MILHLINTLKAKPPKKINSEKMKENRKIRKRLLKLNQIKGPQINVSQNDCKIMFIIAGRSGTLVCQALCTQWTGAWVQFQTRAMIFHFSYGEFGDIYECRNKS